MKIVVTGPVCSDKYFGGVATFTEGLADGFKLSGDEVIILTDYSNKKYTLNGVEILAVSEEIARKKFKTHKDIAKKINEIKPDFVVSSLEYGLANNKLDKSIKTIHYLHGFPSLQRGFLKNFFVEHITRYIANRSSYVLANSKLTQQMNSEKFKTHAKDIVNVAVGYEFLNMLDRVNNDIKCVLNSDEKHVLYTGRLVKDKNVDCIIKGFAKLNEKGVVLDIVGGGPLKEELIDLSKDLSVNVVFHEKVSQETVVKYYRDSKVFISLNPEEPYGIVYPEALACNTNIVCPNRGGQMDTLVNYKERVEFVEPFSEESVAKGIENALVKENKPFDKQYIYDNFSYSKAAIEIKDIYINKIK